MIYAKGLALALVPLFWLAALLAAIVLAFFVNPALAAFAVVWGFGGPCIFCRDYTVEARDGDEEGFVTDTEHVPGTNASVVAPRWLAIVVEFDEMLFNAPCKVVNRLLGRPV